MKKSVLIAMISFATMFMIGCSADFNKREAEGKADVSYNSEKGIISVTLDNVESCNYSMKLNDYEIDNGTVIGNSEMNILQHIKKKKDFFKYIALHAAKNNNEFKVSLKLFGLLDTLFIYHLTPSMSLKDDNLDFSGVGAKVISKSSSRNVNDELKRWLYHKHEIISDSLFAVLRTNYIYLTESNNNDFEVYGEIPVLHSLAGNKYSVSCNMEADYYAIVACREQKFIDKFVENSVVKDYQNLNTTKNNLSCISESNKSGYFCIVLLGINKDYSYQQLPIAVVALDNVAPNKNYLPGKFEGFKFKNNTKVHMPQKTPPIFGYAYIDIIYSDGNGLECNVTFQITFEGDAKSLTIHRRGELCYPNKILGNHLPKADKVIYAKDGSQQRISWKLHFNGGDNEIPVTVEDYHGNKREFNIIYRAKFVRSKEPQINIDNNIDIYN